MIDLKKQYGKNMTILRSNDVTYYPQDYVEWLEERAVQAKDSTATSPQQPQPAICAEYADFLNDKGPGDCTGDELKKYYEIVAFLRKQAGVR